ncbi:MAG: DUF373 family protein [Thaumarchaeota archaeon]|nr:DUF373 family protein [Nitrososphaerota archaeon]
MSGRQERFLILAVDRDGDLERKTRVRTPIWGREAVMSAATSLAVADPEEADANALFAAVKEYDALAGEDLLCDVGAVCGIKDGDFQADRKIRREVEELLAKQKYSGLVLISDGAEDELVIPILQPLKPIVSVRRIVVKHSRTVEENYMVLGRYLRMLVFDPRYSKWAIGIPGVILLLVGVLALFGAGYEALLAVLLILGATFLVRGFNIDRFFATMLSQRPYGYMRLFSIPASILILIVGLSSGFSYMENSAPQLVAQVSSKPLLFLSYGDNLVGYYLQGSLLLVWAAIAVYLAGTLLTQFLRGSTRAWRSVVGLIVLSLLYFPMGQFSNFLITGESTSTYLLITYVFLGLAGIFLVVVTLYTRLRSRPPASVSPGPNSPIAEGQQERQD